MTFYYNYFINTNQMVDFYYWALQIIYIPNIQRFMLYLMRHFRTTLTFSPSQIHKVGSLPDVWMKLREKVQGKCTNQFGFIVLVINPETQGIDKNKVMSLARLDNRDTCSMEVEFSAICFKCEKNDLLWTKVTEVSPDCISCQIGSIQLKIPQSKIDNQLQYDKSLNCFRLKQKNYKIQIGDTLICKCLESRVEQGFEMKIIGQIPANLIGINIGLRK